ERSHRGIFYRGPRRSYEIPVNFVSVGVQIAKAVRALAFDLLGIASRTLAGLAVEPSNGCVVVVRAGVHDAIPNVVVRQVYSLAVPPERELQDSHARKSEIVSQRLDVRSDHSQIFGDDRQLSQRISEGRKKFSPG